MTVMQKSSLVFLTAFFLLTSVILGQSLQRKGTFGATLEAAPEGKGIIVRSVFEQTTASQLGIEEGDVLIQVNGTHFSDVGPLVDAIGTWRQGETLKLEVLRNGSSQKMKGKVAGKPFETSEFGEVIYGEVNFDGGKLRSILELPHGIDNPPVMAFLPGIGCGSLDYPYRNNTPVKLLVESLVKAGIAVYRVEKPGMGDSQGTQDCLEMTFNYEVDAFDAAISTLEKTPGVDHDHIFLFGHSLGVVSAPLIASRHSVAGIIAWGGISSTWYEYSLKLLRDQRVLRGDDFAEIEADFRIRQPFNYDFLVQKMSPEELAKNPAYTQMVEDQFQDDTWHGIHHYTYFYDLADVNILSAYKEAGCPVLALAGEHDIHTVDTRWAGEIAQAVNYYRPGEGSSAIIAKTTHHYHTVPSIPTYYELRAAGELGLPYMAEHFNQEIPRRVQEWIKSEVAKEG